MITSNVTIYRGLFLTSPSPCKLPVPFLTLLPRLLFMILMTSNLFSTSFSLCMLTTSDLCLIPERPEASGVWTAVVFIR
jgi:hypothetical protein